MELDSIEDGVVVDRSGVSRALTQRLSIRFTRPTEVIRADRVERDQVDRIDLDVGVADGIGATNWNHRSLPEAKGDSDAAGGHLGA